MELFQELGETGRDSHRSLDLAEVLLAEDVPVEPEILPPESVEPDEENEEEQFEELDEEELEDSGLAGINVGGREVYARREKISRTGFGGHPKASGARLDNRRQLLKVGTSISHLIQGLHVAEDLASPVHTDDVGEFLKQMTASSNILPRDYHASADKIAEEIYCQAGDRISPSQFEKLIMFHSNDRNYRTSRDIYKLYLRGKVAAILARAGINTITLRTLEKMYLRVPGSKRKSCFVRCSLTKTENSERWGEGYLDRLITGHDVKVKEMQPVGKGRQKEVVHITRLEEDTTIDFDLGLDVYTAISMLPPPWLYAVHYATLGYAYHARDTFIKLSTKEGRKASPLPEKLTIAPLISSRSLVQLSGDYLPLDRRIPPAEYRGFDQTQIQEKFGYSSLAEVQRALHEVETHQHVKILVLGSEQNYDLRGCGYCLMNVGIESMSAVTFTAERAVEEIKQVLTLEGIKEEFIEKDAPFILKEIEMVSGLELKVGNLYLAPVMRKFFREGAQLAYKKLAPMDLKKP